MSYETLKHSHYWWNFIFQLYKAAFTAQNMRCHTGLETTAVDSGQRQSQLGSCWRRHCRYWSDTLAVPRGWPSSDPFPSNRSHPTRWSNTLLWLVSLPSTDTRLLLDWNCVKVKIRLRTVHLWAQPLPAGPLQLSLFLRFFWPWLTFYVICWLILFPRGSVVFLHLLNNWTWALLSSTILPPLLTSLCQACPCQVATVWHLSFCGTDNVWEREREEKKPKKPVYLEYLSAWLLW